MTRPDVVTATAADRASVIRTVVAAFDTDPAFRYFFADPATFTEHATAFAAYLFDKRVDRGTVWTIDHGASVALWDGPDFSPGSEPSLDISAPALERLNRYHDAVDGLLPSEPHWYLGVLATHPHHAGKQWGRAVMGPGLAAAAAAGLPAYLETTNENNVGVYERSGWRIAHSVMVDDLPVWVMVQ